MFLDYYKILSIHPGSNQEMIYEAYLHKSSIYKFILKTTDEKHNQHKALLKEAYETLMNPEARILYDDEWSLRNTKNKTYTSSKLTPSIIYFEANTHELKLGEEITLRWKTLHADQVILLPFGPVAFEGEKVFKITSPEELTMVIELIAENTINGERKTSVLPQSNIGFNGTQRKPDERFKKINQDLSEDSLYQERYQKYLKRKELENTAQKETSTISDLPNQNVKSTNSLFKSIIGLYYRFLKILKQ